MWRLGMLGMRMVMTAIIGAEEGVNIVVNGAVAVSTNLRVVVVTFDRSCTSAKQPFSATEPTVPTLVHNSVQSGQRHHIWTAL